MGTVVSNAVAPAEPPSAGLKEEDAARRLAQAGRPARPAASRSYTSIVRANVLTVFNAILAAFGVVTLIFGDWRDALFLGIIVANSTIGITQEVRAKLALDRLALLVAPQARVIRDGSERQIAVEQLVVGDLVGVRAGDQIVADGALRQGRELRVDESILTGESEPAPKRDGDEVRSGAFAVEGSGSYVVSAVGDQSFAARLVGEARSFRHPRSPLELAVNRLLYSLVGAVVVLGAVLGYSLYHRHATVHVAVATSTAGVVSLVPEGLIVLVSLTYAVAAIRMARRGVLAQQLNAIESLASVDVLCVDKTGTLTESALRVTDVVPAAGVQEEELTRALAEMAAAVAAPNATIDAIAEAYPAPPRRAEEEIPFSSRRRWSAVQLDGAGYVMGAPERLALGALAEHSARHQQQGRRVLALARTRTWVSQPGRDDGPPADSAVLGLVVLAERLRPNIVQTIAFLVEQEVEIKVLSGDAPKTVAAIARDVGIPVQGVSDGADIPSDAAALREFAAQASVVGRISPEGKRAVVEGLRDQGRYVAMLGDGVNDVPALKAARLALAQGSGAQMARSVADLVLVNGDFGAVPALMREGRRALRNLQRVTKLYLTKSAFAAFLILTIGTTSDAYPLLPRHFTLTAALTIGIPTFFLALAPSTGPWRPERFVRRATRFAIPAGTIAGTGVVAGYLFALHTLDYSVMRSRTVAATILIAVGLYLVLVIEATGSRRRSALVGGMCAALAALYVAALLAPLTRHFFKLAVPGAGMIAIGLLAAAVAIAALALSGYSALISSEEGPDRGGAP